MELREAFLVRDEGVVDLFSVSNEAAGRSLDGVLAAVVEGGLVKGRRAGSLDGRGRPVDLEDEE